MIDFWGQPFIEYTIKNLSQLEKIDKIYLIVNYKKELIINYFGEKYNNTPIEYIKQKSPTGGTGDAISYLKNRIKKDFLAILGDVHLSKEHLRQLIDENGTILSVTKINDPQNHKIVEHNKSNQITKFSNNDNWADLGFWRLTPEIFKLIEKSREDFENAEEVKMLPVIEKYLDKLKPRINKNEEPWIQIGDHMGVKGVLIAKDYLGKKYKNKKERESSIQTKTKNCQIENSLIFGPGKLENSKISDSLVFLNKDESNLKLNKKIWAN
jgi:bifunctional UDP-N-acetylglucosamine pyrophosphorylase/glucosamine-1-phosphate N-acetyltransferase